jgi:hypothetical protein
MSRANIIAMNPDDCSVVFQTRRQGVLTYYYEKSDFVSIVGGDDPANYEGSRTPRENIASTIGEAADIAGEILDTIPEIGFL